MRYLIFLIFFLVLSCKDDSFITVDQIYDYSAIFYYINETTDTITIAGGSGCGYHEFLKGGSVTIQIPEDDASAQIMPGDTLILHHINLRIWGGPPYTVDNYGPHYARGCVAIYDSDTCDTGYDPDPSSDRRKSYGFGNIINYENRKEIGRQSFEFTYRFTKETKAQAEARNCVSKE